MKEIEKKETPEVSGGYRPDNGGGCIPPGVTIIKLPGETGDYPQTPISPWSPPEPFVTDPPAV